MNERLSGSQEAQRELGAPEGLPEQTSSVDGRLFDDAQRSERGVIEAKPSADTPPGYYAGVLPPHDYADPAVAHEALLPNQGIVELPTEQRYAENQLITDPHAKVEHFRAGWGDRIKGIFTPTVQRDTFGNRLFSSPDQAYVKADNQEHTKAALLLSAEGESWLRQNPGILDDIDRGLVVLTQPSDVDSSQQAVDLGRGRRLSRMIHAEGAKPAQSEVYILEADNRKYVVKRAKPDSALAHPYLDSMLQTQALARDMAQQFASVRVELPTYLFATGQVACVEFVEGTTPDAADTTARLGPLRAQVDDYLLDQRRRGGLWKDMHSDMLNPDNYIKRPDSRLVCIDPLIPVNL